MAIFAAPEASASVLFGLYDMLGSVGTIWPEMTAAEPGEAALDVFIVALTGQPFRCSGGVLVEPRAGIVKDIAPIAFRGASSGSCPRGKPRQWRVVVAESGEAIRMAEQLRIPDEMREARIQAVAHLWAPVRPPREQGRRRNAVRDRDGPG
jgi:hypothetical protein